MPELTPQRRAASQRLLRQARIENALNLERSVDIERHRDRLLSRLSLEAARAEPADFAQLPEGAVDLVVSLATADVAEAALDRLAVALLCIETLAKDGQFARLSIIADRLLLLRDELSVKRPILATSVVGLANWLKGFPTRAARNVDGEFARLRQEPQLRTAETECDLLLMTSLRSRLDPSRTSNRDWDANVRDVLLAQGDGLASLFHDTLCAFGRSSAMASPSSVLPSVDPVFARVELAEYVSGRASTSLFPAQIDALRRGVSRVGSQVVALPTSSGKTMLAEFRVAASFARNPEATAIYVAPYRLLSRQVRRSIGQGLRPLGVQVRDLGAGYDASEGSAIDLAGVHLAVCTPERLDALLRLADTDSTSGVDARTFLETCRLLIFDELQMVGRQGRGPRFELLVTRIRERFPLWDVLGLSAATQGADDLAQWLVGAEPTTGARRPTGTLEVLWDTDGSLHQRVESTTTTSVGHLPRTGNASDDAANLILRFGLSHQPVLVVEASRPWAESLARKVRSLSLDEGAEWLARMDDKSRQDVEDIVEEVRATLGERHHLADMILEGIAYHHAGVPTHLLRHIEDLAQRRLLRLMCATTTVAEGADLPFRVVVIPHLNFPPTRTLERDLYLNIIGRAGRANVAVEGMVFILNSDAPTLRDVVRGSLWANVQRDRVRGRLADAVLPIRDFESLNLFFDIQSQVMGWLGDGDSYIEGQPEHLARRTLSWLQGDSTERERIEATLSASLSDLEDRGFALAASPYQLTPAGFTARRTGLSAMSVENLAGYLTDSHRERFTALEEAQFVTDEDALVIADLIFQAVEMLEASLWLRRSGSSEDNRFRVLAGPASGNAQWPNADEMKADTDLVARWMRGSTLEVIADAAPRVRSALSLFGGSNRDKLTSDAAEYIGKISYPAAWVWSGIRVLSDDLAPGYIRSCLEFGVPTATAGVLVREAQMTRDGANRVAELAGPSWPEASRWVQQADAEELSDLGLTSLDWKRLTSWLRADR